MPVTFLLRRDVAADWAIKNPILREGEMGQEVGTNRFKLGDGLNAWNDLPYFTNEDQIKAYIDAEIAALAGSVSGVTQQQLADHINSLAPHLNWEDGADLTLLYENAKV
jgi:Major tropism determinant N-terminal domain